MKNILLNIYFYFCVAICSIICFFTTKLFCHGNAQSGKLIVIGKDKVEIELKHLPPHHVIVKFDDNCAPNPCNPHHHHHDQLCWEIVKTNHHHHVKKDRYILIIQWHVESCRVIKWEVL